MKNDLSQLSTVVAPSAVIDGEGDTAVSEPEPAGPDHPAGTSPIDDLGETIAAGEAPTARKSGIIQRLTGADSKRLGRFVLLDQLGAGGMGVVYSAYDPHLDRRVALKVLKPKQDQEGTARERLVREAKALAKLSHPNVVPIHDVAESDGQVVLVMEYVKGKSLTSWLAAEPRRWSDILDVYLQAGKGLAAAHAAGIVHRDFKPDNVIVGADGRVRVVDFGLARDTRSLSEEHASPSLTPHDESTDARTGATSSSETDFIAVLRRAGSSVPQDQSSLTTVGMVMGTPTFMSPQQMTGDEVGWETDQFSFCVALFHSLYGHRPYAGDSLDEIYESAVRGSINAPEDRNSGLVPAWIYPILAKGLCFDPGDRFPSMEALLDRLNGYRSRDLRASVRTIGWMFLVAAAITHVIQLIVAPGVRGATTTPMAIGTNGMILAGAGIFAAGLIVARRHLRINPISMQLYGLLLHYSMSVGAMRVVLVHMELTVAQAVPLETMLLAILTGTAGITIARATFVLALIYLLGFFAMLGYPDHSAILFTVTNLTMMFTMLATLLWRPLQAVPADALTSAAG